MGSEPTSIQEALWLAVKAAAFALPTAMALALALPFAPAQSANTPQAFREYLVLTKSPDLDFAQVKALPISFISLTPSLALHTILVPAHVSAGHLYTHGAKLVFAGGPSLACGR